MDDVTRQRYMTRFQAGDIAGTSDYLQSLLVQGVNDEVAAEIYEALSKGFLAEFRIDDAAVVLDHWIAWRPDAQALRWRAELHEQDEDWKGAAALYRKLITIAPGDVSAYLHLGDTLLADLQVEEAKAIYTEARDRFPNEALSYLGLAQCARRLGNSDESVSLLQKILVSDLQDSFKAHALSELGQIALDSSDYDGAVKHFEASLQLNTDSQTLHLLGTAYARLGKTEEANVQFAKAKHILDIHRRMKALILEIAKHPSKVDERYEIGNLLLELGNADKACRWFFTVIHLNPGHAGARAELAKYFATQGNSELAQAHHRAAQPTQSSATSPRSQNE
jgi:tetratricopeptide (TPR) repeat protein